MVQIRAGSPAWYPQHLSNFRVRKALDIVEDDHRPRPIRKLRQRMLEPLAQLTALRRIAERSWNGFGQFLRVSDLASPRQIERCVSDDSIQPRSKCLFGIEPIQRLVRPQKSFLHRVFGILVRENDRSRHYVSAPLVQTHEAGETPLVPLLGQTNERSLLVRNTYGCVQVLAG